MSIPARYPRAPRRRVYDILVRVVLEVRQEFVRVAYVHAQIRVVRGHLFERVVLLRPVQAYQHVVGQRLRVLVRTHVVLRDPFFVRYVEVFEQQISEDHWKRTKCEWLVKYVHKYTIT